MNKAIGGLFVALCAMQTYIYLGEYGSWANAALAILDAAIAFYYFQQEERQ